MNGTCSLGSTGLPAHQEAMEGPAVSDTHSPRPMYAPVALSIGPTLRQTDGECETDYMSKYEVPRSPSASPPLELIRKVSSSSQNEKLVQVRESEYAEKGDASSGLPSLIELDAKLAVHRKLETVDLNVDMLVQQSWDAFLNGKDALVPDERQSRGDHFGYPLALLDTTFRIGGVFGRPPKSISSFFDVKRDEAGDFWSCDIYDKPSPPINENSDNSTISTTEQPAAEQEMEYIRGLGSTCKVALESAANSLLVQVLGTEAPADSVENTQNGSGAHQQKANMNSSFSTSHTESDSETPTYGLRGKALRFTRSLERLSDMKKFEVHNKLVALLRGKPTLVEQARVKESIVSVFIAESTHKKIEKNSKSENNIDIDVRKSKGYLYRDSDVSDSDASSEGGLDDKNAKKSSKKKSIDSASTSKKKNSIKPTENKKKVSVASSISKDNNKAIIDSSTFKGTSGSLIEVKLNPGISNTYISPVVREKPPVGNSTYDRRRASEGGSYNGRIGSEQGRNGEHRKDQSRNQRALGATPTGEGSKRAAWGDAPRGPRKRVRGINSA